MKKKKHVIRNLLFLLGFLAGLGILIYPLVSDRWNAYRDSLLISDYSESAAEEDKTEEYAEMLAAAQKYNDELKQESVPDAFSVRDGLNDPAYNALLHIDDTGLMGYVEIPAIEQTLPIYHYTTSDSLEKGVGHLFGSSLPIGGESTHAVLSAHRGLPTAKLFSDLNLLEIGDVFYIHVLDETLAYEVDQILTVEPTQTESLAIEEGKDLVSLVTCTPYAVNTHRLLVRGHRVPFEQEVYEEQQQQAPKKDVFQIWMQVLCVVIGLVIAFVIVRIVTSVSMKTDKKAGSKRLEADKKSSKQLEETAERKPLKQPETVEKENTKQQEADNAKALEGPDFNKKASSKHIKRKQ